MRILFDARKIFDGGIGRYIRNTLEGLGRTEGCSVTVILDERYKSSDLSEIPSIEGNEKVNFIVNTSGCYSLKELYCFESCFKVQGGAFNWNDYDIFHTPHYVLPNKIPIPTVITIHDLIHITHPEKWFYPLIAKFLLRSSVKRTSGIVCVSESTFLDIEVYLPNVKLPPVKVIPNSLGVNFEKEQLDSVVEEKIVNTEGFEFLCSNEPFLLSVISDNKPHKGLGLLFESYVEYFNSVESPAKLVVVGRGSKGFLASSLNFSKEKYNNRDIENSIIELGMVSEEELSFLYSRATALVVSSMAEGFCLPVLEAHNFGTRVLSTPIPAVVELLTDEDLAVPSFTVGELANGINEILKRPFSARYELDDFSIDSCTKKLFSFYRELLESKG